MNIRANATFAPGNVSAVLEGVTKRALAAVQTGTAVILERAQAFAPFDTGQLHDSIHSQVALRGLIAEGVVYAEAPHSAFLEFGTGLTGQASAHGALPETGVPFTGSWIYDWRGRGWVGMPAQPYLRPALDTSGPEVLQAFRAQGFKI